MTALQETLFSLRDEEYAAFQAKLTPGIPPEKFIGVRVPLLRKLAKAYFKAPDSSAFLSSLPHDYYEENLLHGLLIEQLRGYEETVSALNRFLPYVDNWAVCDTMSPKAFKKHPSGLFHQAKEWSASDAVYTCRFGIGVLMSQFLDDAFVPEVLEIPAAVHSDEYYVNMMIAWFFATALAKQWDSAIPYLQQNRLDLWTHNKTIQKAIESYRITDERKAYLRTLKRK